MIIKEINIQTGQITEREMTAEEIAQMEAVQNEEVHEPEGGVPQVITSRQLRLQWVMSGHDLSDIDNAINLLPDPHKEIVRINWEYAGTFDRYNDLLLNVADSLGITPEQLDEIFTNASIL